MRHGAFRQSAVTILALAIALSLALQATAEAQGPPGRDHRCAGLGAAARGVCIAFLAAGCDDHPRPSCSVFRRLFLRFTGSPFFPFEPTPTPTQTPVPTDTATPTQTPTVLAEPGIAKVGSGPASLLVFPRVLASGGRDTIIQMSNAAASTVYAHCVYLDAAALDPTQPVSASNPRQYIVTDFILTLTGHQPTQWRVSTGRLTDPADPLGSPGAGIDPAFQPPAAIPASHESFTGELRCYQVDASDVPTGGNALTGTATLLGPGEEVAGYDAISFRALADDGDHTLHLDGVEYDACPDTSYFLHRGDGPLSVAPFPALSVHLVLTAVPCVANYEERTIVRAGMLISLTDEFELILSAAAPGEHWNEFTVDDMLALQNLAPAEFKLSRVRTSPSTACTAGDNGPGPCITDADCGAGGLCQRVSFLPLLEIDRSGIAGHAIDVQSPQSEGSQVGFVGFPFAQ